MSLKTPQTHGQRARNRWLHPISKFGSKEHPQIQWSLATGSSWHTFSVLSRPFTILVDRMKHALQYAICSFHVRYWVDCWPLWAGPCAAMKQVEWYCWSHMSITIFPLFIFYHSCSVALTCSQTESWNKLLPFSPKRPRDLWEDHLWWNVKGTSQRCFSFWDLKCLPNPEDWNALNILGSDTYGSTAAFGNLHPLPVKKAGKCQKSSYSARPAQCEVGDLIFWSIYIQPPYIPSYWKQNQVGLYLFLLKKNADLPPFQPNNSPGYKAMNVPR